MVVVITVIIVVIYNNGKKPKGYKNAVDSITTDTTLDQNKVLKVGVIGAEVKALQNLANQVFEKANNPKRLLTDGVFGSSTQSALQSLTNKTEITLKEAVSLFNKYF